MATEWFHFKGDQQIGPVSFEELKSLAASGGILPADLVWNHDMADRQPASTLTELFVTDLQKLAVIDQSQPIRNFPPSHQDQSKAGVIVKLLWDWLNWCVGFALQVSWNIATATWYAATVVIGDVWKHLEAHRLKGELEKQQTALGEFLHSKELGDFELRRQLLENDQARHQAERDKASTTQIAIGRKLLLIELAEAAMTSELFSDETKAVREAQESLEHHEQQFANLTSTRPPIDQPRAWIGAAIVLIMTFSFAADKSKNQPYVSSNSKPQQSANNNQEMPVVADANIPRSQLEMAQTKVSENNLTRISATDLIDAFSNELAGRKKFGGKTVEVTGLVVKVAQSWPSESAQSKQYCVVLGGDSGPRGFTTWLECFVDNPSDLDSVVPGIGIVVRGKVQDRSGPTTRMTKCEIAQE